MDELEQLEQTIFHEIKRTEKALRICTVHKFKEISPSSVYSRCALDRAREAWYGSLVRDIINNGVD